MVTTVFTEGCKISASFLFCVKAKKGSSTKRNKCFACFAAFRFPLLHTFEFCDWSREWGMSRMWNWEWRVGNVELGMESRECGIGNEE